jgi:hypothetical protein
MQTIQLVLSDVTYARKLKQLLSASGTWSVVIREFPVFDNGGVVVLDETVLAGLSSAPPNPDRVVLVTNNDPELLSSAWDLGIRSVVYHSDSPSTVLLAIMSAFLRVPKSARQSSRRAISPRAPRGLLTIDPAPNDSGHD